MFNPLKIAQQMKDAQKKMKQIQDDLKKERITVANNTVQITTSGDQTILAVQLNPDVVNIPNREALERVLKDTINEALEKSKEAGVSKMKDLTAGMNIPGLPGF